MASIVILLCLHMQEDQIKEKNEKYPIMIYAKSYCPFCSQVGNQVFKTHSPQ